jgi:hypothetical protein
MQQKSMHYVKSMDQSCEQEVYDSSFMILSIGVSALEPLTNQHVVAVPPSSVRAECFQRPAIFHEIGANLTRNDRSRDLLQIYVCLYIWLALGYSNLYEALRGCIRPYNGDLTIFEPHAELL